MNKEYVYLSVGDSLTAGYGAPEGDGFVNLLHRHLQKSLGVPIRLINAGVNGATTADVLARLRSDPNLRQAVAISQIMTVTAGGNDLLRAAEAYFKDRKIQHLTQALKKCRGNFKLIMQSIEQLKQGAEQPYIIAVAELYNPSPGVAEAVLCIKRFNGIIRKLKAGPVHIANVYSAYRGREPQLLDKDLIHPNAEGHKVIAERFCRICWQSVISQQPNDDA